MYSMPPWSDADHTELDRLVELHSQYQGTRKSIPWKVVTDGFNAARMPKRTLVCIKTHWHQREGKKVNDKKDIAHSGNKPSPNSKAHPPKRVRFVANPSYATCPTTASHTGDTGYLSGHELLKPTSLSVMADLDSPVIPILARETDYKDATETSSMFASLRSFKKHGATALAPSAARAPTSNPISTAAFAGSSNQVQRSLRSIFLRRSPISSKAGIINARIVKTDQDTISIQYKVSRTDDEPWFSEDWWIDEDDLKELDPEWYGAMEIFKSQPTWVEYVTTTVFKWFADA
jgi:hypothetical protein